MPNLKDLMLQKRLTLAVAESLTCGHLQARIGAIPGASRFFLGGLTAYTLEEKAKLLGVPRELAGPVDCVSGAVAVAMAQGARSLFGAGIAIATTGYAEPAPAAPVPYAWIAVGDGVNFISRRVDCPGLARVAVQEHIAKIARDILVDFLQSSR
ncbi:nicotinamide-nucleotide amidase [Ereboglobus sp. PH5-5]|uniref:CinA family protein n=1 Tax=unclassified Ereboglobus TaxID=2626932 RepID=UPI002406AC8F|nr:MULTISPECIES: nicotinamide-nucleotide amidohydrolase family protein [unclassified Ereboglobus]MDF9827977.1 nicotinamide-nucleotide amidase [Ereboglobus sp. PH5-10]MDF9832379.1 nicotinamide-nucleotide amidase [Ereboglobus sp. PH5-5]